MILFACLFVYLKLMGTWYSVRWYMPNFFKWSDDAWDYSHTFSMKEGMEDGFLLTRNFRYGSHGNRYIKEILQQELQKW